MREYVTAVLKEEKSDLWDAYSPLAGVLVGVVLGYIAAVAQYQNPGAAIHASSLLVIVAGLGAIIGIGIGMLVTVAVVKTKYSEEY